MIACSGASKVPVFTDPRRSPRLVNKNHATAPFSLPAFAEQVRLVVLDLCRASNARHQSFCTCTCTLSTRLESRSHNRTGGGCLQPAVADSVEKCTRTIVEPLPQPFIKSKNTMRGYPYNSATAAVGEATRVVTALTKEKDSAVLSDTLHPDARGFKSMRELMNETGAGGTGEALPIPASYHAIDLHSPLFVQMCVSIKPTRCGHWLQSGCVAISAVIDTWRWIRAESVPHCKIRSFSAMTNSTSS